MLNHKWIIKLNETVVSFTLDRVGAKRFGKATSTGIGKQLAIVLDGKIVSAPVIRGHYSKWKWPNQWKFYISICNRLGITSKIRSITSTT